MTSQTAPARQRSVASSSGGRPWAALVILAAALALDSGSVAVINSALPDIGRDMNMSEATLQWTMTAYAVAFAGFLLLGGRAADVLGRRLCFGVGVGLFAVSAVCAAVAPDTAVLIAARAGQGLGAALSGPASLALVTQLFPEGPQRNKALAIYTSVGASSFSIGLILGGVLTDAFGWRSVFIVSTAIGTAVLFSVRATLPASVRRPQSLDVFGAVVVTAGLALAVFGVSRASTEGWGATDVVVALVAAVVLLLVFVLWERRTASPLLPLSIFRSGPVRAATLTAVTFFTALLGMLFLAPLYMQGILGYSPLESGAAIVPMGILVIVSANTAGRLMARVGQRPLMALGLLLIAVGVGVLWARVPLDGNYWVDILPGVAVMSVGQGIAFAAMTAASMTGVPQEQHGVASGFNVTAQQVGGSMGVAVLVTVANAFTDGTGAADILRGYHAAFITGGAVAAAGALVVGLSALGRKGRADALQPTEAG
ncbi:MFS transporter [Streptomyces sp. NBC_01136]|uniref:MFS transporter n=1 Tax=unclassified Streptomyces TaxID=2593676 RepID=UPI0032450142|nr:MFS transporter [Streptomyces sp. NBC_01136]